ncbi:hypothetical protein AJ79_01430 [Helicocarpus griseus UAMH5409]|uniref:Essential protein Yae1 N-terminal domain-containing protein n=1 Tax=Helicocarpus griseus UAMH5409 TaxID=1447875 RepID=A0A2B7Y699_9EURO|nr:hypothetical protein AJ79_01430 [Helicocarpus griseus UAMH5409]
MDHDLLDSLLNLEEGFYKEGYELGVSDGARAGYSEGSVFAVEKGFDKFQEMGRLYGKAIIWAKRLPGDHGLLLNPANSTATATAKSSASDTSLKANLEQKDTVSSSIASTPTPSLPVLPPNSRLEKHIATLLSLVDPLTLSTQNSEDAVADFDERLKKAASKAKVIERILGEQNDSSSNRDGNAGGAAAAGGGGSGGTGNIEDIGPLPARMLQMD